jgi:hypothetical protein
MRSSFPGYYPPTEGEYKALWESGLIVLDTNALLNMYRYSPATRSEFFAVLTSVQERLWVPAQVAREFLDRRLDVIYDQTSAFDSVRAALDESAKRFESEVNRFRRHSSLDADSLLTEAAAAKAQIVRAIAEREKTHISASEGQSETDDIWERISTLLESRVGGPFSDEELAAIYIEGKGRYAAEVPPGYKDSSKGEPGKFGDLILWKQLLRHAGAEKKPAIFVTDDSKEDWWRIVRGQRIGARPELVHEYLAAAENRIHFYSPMQFLREATVRTEVGISEKALGEVEQVSTDANERLRVVALRRLDDLERRRRSLLRHADRAEGHDVSQERARMLTERDRLQNDLRHAEILLHEGLRLASGESRDQAESARRAMVFLRENLSAVEHDIVVLEERSVASRELRQQSTFRQIQQLDGEIDEIRDALGGDNGARGGAAS